MSTLIEEAQPKNNLFTRSITFKTYILYIVIVHIRQHQQKLYSCAITFSLFTTLVSNSTKMFIPFNNTLMHRYKNSFLLLSDENRCTHKINRHNMNE